MLAREKMRQLVVAALEQARVPATIKSPADWSTVPAKLPAILVRAAGDRKESIGRNGPPQFTTTAFVELKLLVRATTAEDVQAQLAALGDAVEQAIFGNFALGQAIQQFASAEAVTEVTAEEKQHLGGTGIRLAIETYEEFEPFIGDFLEEVVVTATEPSPRVVDRIQVGGPGALNLADETNSALPHGLGIG